MHHRTLITTGLLAALLPLSAQNTFEITIPITGLTNVAGGHQTSDGTSASASAPSW